MISWFCLQLMEARRLTCPSLKCRNTWLSKAGKNWAETSISTEEVCTLTHGMFFPDASRIVFFRYNTEAYVVCHKAWTQALLAETSQIRLYVQVNNDAAVDYLVDTASLTAFYLSPTWKDEANARIEDIRKNDITIKFVLRSWLRPCTFPDSYNSYNPVHFALVRDCRINVHVMSFCVTA